MKIVLRGAFCALRLNVPKGTPVTVRGNRFPFNIVKSNIKGEPGRAGYEIQLENVFSAVALEVRPADNRRAPASPEAPAAPAPPRRPKPEAEPGGSPAPVRG